MTDNCKVVITFGEQTKKSKTITSRVDNNLPKTGNASRFNRTHGVHKCQKEIKYDFKEVCNDFLANKLDELLTSRVVELTKENFDKCKYNGCMIFYGKCKTLITPIEEGKNRYEIKESQGRKKALTIEQIKDIIKYEDGLESSEKYCDIWVFIFLCNGMNVADMIRLKNDTILDNELLNRLLSTDPAARSA